MLIRSGTQDWRVFYHFVGAVPGSTDVMQLIKRLLVEAGVDKTNLPQDMEGAVQMSASLLNSSSSPPLIIFIDALNQVIALRLSSCHDS